MEKWNPKTHRYYPYSVPDEWNTPLYTSDMEEIVNCAHCGKKIAYGLTHTSKQIHNSFGLGYSVCPECYKKEWDEENENS